MTLKKRRCDCSHEYLSVSFCRGPVTGNLSPSDGWDSQFPCDLALDKQLRKWMIGKADRVTVTTGAWVSIFSTNYSPIKNSFSVFPAFFSPPVRKKTPQAASVWSFLQSHVDFDSLMHRNHYLLDLDNASKTST